MRVVGISPLDKDATASFVEDGRVLFACGEERLTRVKLQSGFPRLAIREGLSKLGWDPASVDVVAYAFFDAEGEAKLMQKAFEADRQRSKAADIASSLRLLGERWRSDYHVDRSTTIHGIDDERAEFVPPKSAPKQVAYDLLRRSAALDTFTHRRGFRSWIRRAKADHELRNEQLRAGLEEFGWSDRLRRFRHHDTHAANAFFASGFEEALLVTFDGYGSGAAGGIYEGRGSEIRPLHHFPFPNSLGQFYEQVTSALGFRPGRHEGKIVGLAAYGDPNVLGSCLRSRFDVAEGDYHIRNAMNDFFARILASKFAKRDVAAVYQTILEEVATEVVAHWVRKTGSKNIAVSGGVHANVKLNQRFREIEGVESIFVYPNMGDGGCGSGAALLAERPEHRRNFLIENAYHGPCYGEDEIRQALERQGLKFETCENVEDRVAELLAAQKVVARFDGRMEYGPRALGNRSILYSAKDPAVNQWLNRQLGRTEFMPFAPAALAEHAHRLFRNIAGCEKTAEFMTITFDCTEEMVERCPAATHVDHTARPQFVTERSNAGFHRILTKYHELTGTPAIINTSFNMHEEPIVCSPDDAARAFVGGNLDYLAIGPYLAAHPSGEHRPATS